MSEVRQPWETLEGQGLPTVRQLSVFVDNRVGQLLRITQLFEKQDISILGLSVVDSADFAVVRLLFNRPDDALSVLTQAGFPVSVSELVVVHVPAGKGGLMAVWSALLGSEINIAYAYSLLRTEGGPAIALHVDNIEIAIDTLVRKGFQVFGEADLES
jgi:hypothetical protein